LNSALFERIGKRLASVSLAAWVLVAMALGIATGLFFGDYCSILAPIGAAYMMMLQAAAYPLIICLIILGIGGLSGEKCARLFRHSWPFYILAIGLTLLVLFALWFAIPKPPPPAAIDAAKPHEAGTSLLQILIPANVFEALTRNYLPGVVLFALPAALTLRFALSAAPEKIGNSIPGRRRSSTSTERERSASDTTSTGCPSPTSMTRGNSLGMTYRALTIWRGR